MLKEKFTRQIYQLCVKQNIDVADSLELMAVRKTASFFSEKIQKAALFLLNELKAGETLSTAMKTCSYINFDEVYVQAIHFAEMNGNLLQTLSFLYERCERHKKNMNKLIEACTYPFFVMLVAIIGCTGLIYISSGNGAFFAGINDLNMKSKLIEYVSLLVIVCALAMIFIIKAVGENKIYEAFYISGFLIKAGMNVSNAIACGQIIVGEDSRTGRKFGEAREKIEYGMGLEEAFSINNKISEALYYADKSGRKSDVFEKIAEQIGEKDEMRRKICLELIEPLFIVITGAFLMILVINFFMPFLNNTNWF